MIPVAGPSPYRMLIYRQRTKLIEGTNIVNRVKSFLHSLFSKGFFHILLGGTLSKIISFVSSILIVRFVTKTDYAYLSYADNLYSYIYLISGIGLESAILKFCISDDKERNSGYFRYALKIGSLAELIILVVFLIIINISELAFPESIYYIYAQFFYPFVYLFVSYFLSFFRARLKNKEYALGGIIQSLLVLLISLGLVLMIQAYSVIVARYVAGLGTIIYFLAVFRKEAFIGDYRLTSGEKKQFLKFGLALMITNVFSMIMPINENFLVNNLIRDTVATANFKVASMIPQQLTFVTSAIVTFTFPYFARMTDPKEIWQKSKKVGLLTFFAIVAIALIGILVSPWLIMIFYGDKYSDITGLMNLLWIMYSLNAGIRMIPMNILPAIGITKFNIVMSVVSCVIHFFTEYYFIKNMGIDGVIYAGVIVYIVSGIAYWTYLRKKVKDGSLYPSEN